MTTPFTGIDPASPAPPYEQLRDQVEAMVAAGELRPGDRLPTVRRLAGDLGIAPGTVARAYRELEQRGLLEGRGRAGSFIADDDANRAAQAAAHAYLERVRALGLSGAEAVSYVQRLIGGAGTA
ncbi:GntR family transcriptional regulator [Georgenia sp. MJ173]|uniref:GntR family transcriptional regulator n=1 Tax=Georgenia sunbinii TaxID=3117728 RepID=UPI002F25F9AC